MPDPVLTEVEKRLNTMMAQYGDPSRAMALMYRFKELAMRMQFENVPYDLIAYALAQHASSAIAAMKIVGAIRPALAEALAEDFTETMHRAHPGTPQLGNKQ